MDFVGKGWVEEVEKGGGRVSSGGLMGWQVGLLRLADSKLSVCVGEACRDLSASRRKSPRPRLRLQTG
jgi:hypothetical protein